MNKPIAGLIPLVCLLSSAGFAQEFAIKKFEMDGERLNVYYDLIDSIPGHTYTVLVYSSKDSYAAPVTRVAGDVGREVKPGMNKKLVWSAKEELGSGFEGKVSIQVRGKLYIPFIRFDRFKEHEVRKRGVPFDILWNGGRPSSLLNFELERNGEFVQAPFTNVANLGSYTARIPNTVRPGKGYRFKITDSKNKDEFVYTNEFTIKRKVPLVAKLAVCAVAGVVAIELLKPPDEIKDPPAPPKR